jgi:hypothetical protein
MLLLPCLWWTLWLATLRLRSEGSIRTSLLIRLPLCPHLGQNMMPSMSMTRLAKERPTLQVRLMTFRPESCPVQAPFLAGGLCCHLHRLNKQPLVLNALLMIVVMRYAATGVLQVHLIRREVGLEFWKACKAHRGYHPIFCATFLKFYEQQMGEAMSSPQRAPAPRRATLASQKLSRKKLAAPFRSPMQATPITAKVDTPVSQREVPREQIFKEPQAKCQAVPNPVCLRVQKTLVRSSRAAAQFRSPLVKTVEHGPRPLVLPSQGIMTLERKLTLLRRAVKIKRDGDESHLERLSMKWRDAAREGAYELWSIVRDLSTGGGEVRSSSSDVGWGWEERKGHGTSGTDAEDEECGVQQENNTLGVMLRKFGIAPETLGWNDEEETFVDGDDVRE